MACLTIQLLHYYVYSLYATKPNLFYNLIMLSENVLTIACQNPKTAFVMLGIIVHCSPNFLFCNNK